jgi:hypothetical protein
MADSRPQTSEGVARKEERTKKGRIGKGSKGKEAK